MLFDRFALPLIDNEDAYRVSFGNASEHKSIPPDIDLPLWLEVVREPGIVFQNPRTKRQDLARSWHLHLQLSPRYSIEELLQSGVVGNSKLPQAPGEFDD